MKNNNRSVITQFGVYNISVVQHIRRPRRDVKRVDSTVKTTVGLCALN